MGLWRTERSGGLTYASNGDLRRSARCLLFIPHAHHRAAYENRRNSCLMLPSTLSAWVNSSS